MRPVILAFIAFLQACSTLESGTETSETSGEVESSTGEAPATSGSTGEPEWCVGDPCDHLGDCDWSAGAMVCARIHPGEQAVCLPRCGDDSGCTVGRCIIVTFVPEEIRVCWDGANPVPAC